MFPILELPTELVEGIITSITDLETLFALTLTSRKLRAFAEVQLYRDVRIHLPRKGKRLAKVLNARPDLYSLIKRFEPSIPERKEGWAGFPELARHMTQLQILWIENGITIPVGHDNPMAENGVEGWMKEFESVIREGLRMDGPFSKLTTLKVLTEGYHSAYYDMDSLWPIFVSPTLQTIHITCAALENPMRSLIPYDSLKRHTPLKKLELERCRISHWDGFKTLLSMPRALRSLTMRMTPSREDDSEDALRALREQAETLEYLCYARFTHGAFLWDEKDLRDWARHYTVVKNSHLESTGFSSFSMLKALDIDYRSNLTRTLFHARWTPPNLHILGVTGPSLDDLGLSSFSEGLASAASFRQLVLHTVHSGYRHTGILSVHDHLFATKERRNVTSSIADMLKETSRGLKVLCVHDKRNYIQPYRFNEEKPSVEVIFDNGKEHGEHDEFFIYKQEHFPEPYAAVLPYAHVYEY